MRVYLESPYRNGDPEEHQKNIDYAKACALDCIERGENPFVSHLFFTQFLDDNDPDDRTLGMNMGFKWALTCAISVFYTDRGMSEGMTKGLERAIREERTREFRKLPTPNAFVS